MSKPCILVESQAKMKTLQEIFPDDFLSFAIDQAPVTVNCDPASARPSGEVGFVFTAVKAWQERLKKVFSNSSDVYLAMDMDSEGEYLCWILQGYAQAQRVTEPHRVHLAGISREAVLDGVKYVEPVDSQSSAALYFRAIFQHCFSGHLQRLLGTNQGPGGLNLTPFVLTVLSLMAERDVEMQAMNRSAKFELNVRLAVNDCPLPITVDEIFNVSGDGLIANSNEASTISKKMAAEKFTVRSVDTSSLEIEPPPPYDISDLLYDAHRFYGIGYKVGWQGVLDLLQGNVGGTCRGLITSPFFSGFPYQKQVLASIRAEVEKAYSQDEMTPRDITDLAILPLQPELAVDDIDAESEAVRNIYDLIRCRAMAWQMQAVKGEQHSFLLESDSCRGKGQQVVVIQSGFLQQYKWGYDSLLAASGEGVKKGQVCSVAQVVVARAEQQVSQWYSLPQLSAECREFGAEIGRETMNELLGLLAKGYITVDEEGLLRSTENLKRVLSGLDRAFPGMKGLNLIAYYEQTVAEVLSGRKRLDVALRQFDQNLVMHGTPLVKVTIPKHLPKKRKKSARLIKSGSEVTARPAKSTGQKKPPAEQETEPLFADFSEPVAVESKVESLPIEDEPGEEVEASIANDDSVITVEEDVEVAEEGQEDQPEPVLAKEEEAPVIIESSTIVKTEPSEVKEAVEIPEEPVLPVGPPSGNHVDPPPVTASKETADHESAPVLTRPCPECGRSMILKTDRFGKYWACSGLPACHHSESHCGDEVIEKIDCPVCGHSPLGIKRTQTGKEMYVCPGADCDFMAWARPHSIRCPLCQSPFLVEKKDRQGQVSLRCPRAGCSYSRDLDKELSAQSPSVEKKPAKKRIVRRKKGSSGKAKKRVVVRRKKK